MSEGIPAERATGSVTNQALSGPCWFTMRFTSGLASSLDPELLQARWVLGGIEPEQFVAIAVSARSLDL